MRATSARRVRGKRGRGASGETIVFGIFKRNGCVYEGFWSFAKRRLQKFNDVSA